MANIIKKKNLIKKNIYRFLIFVLILEFNQNNLILNSEMTSTLFIFFTAGLKFNDFKNKINRYLLNMSVS